MSFTEKGLRRAYRKGGGGGSKKVLQAEMDNMHP